MSRDRNTRLPPLRAANQRYGRVAGPGLPTMEPPESDEDPETTSTEHKAHKAKGKEKAPATSTS